jgi:crossover junction endodeoxyribonuclease RuvC
MIFIGIDPGLSGAVAVINDVYDHVNPQYSVHDTPTLEMMVNGKKKNRYNVNGMVSLLAGFESEEVLVVLESVHSMPKQGVASSFNFGEGLGMWKGIVAAFGFPLEMPTPQRWMKAIMEGTGGGKDANRNKAIQLFPSLADQLKLVKHDGRADALLMAEFGRRLRN